MQTLCCDFLETPQHKVCGLLKKLFFVLRFYKKQQHKRFCASVQNRSIKFLFCAAPVCVAVQFRSTKPQKIAAHLDFSTSDALEMEEGTSLQDHLYKFNGLITQLTSLEAKIDEEDKAILLWHLFLKGRILLLRVYLLGRLLLLCKILWWP